MRRHRAGSQGRLIALKMKGMKRILGRTAYALGLMTVILLLLPACLKKGNTTILVNDPQEIPFITEFLPQDLLELFGEENVYFGDQPPLVDMEFQSIHEYVGTNLVPPYAPQPGQLSPIVHYHKLQHQFQQITEYVCMSSEEKQCKLISPVYMTGHDSCFTAYFHETVATEGLPLHAVLFSGKLTHEGIRDFVYGYEILQYNDSVTPGTVYPVNSIFIFKDHDGLAEIGTWYHDGLMDPPKP